MLERQVRRMLADPRAESLVTNFAGQWLYLRDIDAKLPDDVLFPDFDETLRQALRRETELFFEQRLREDRSVLDLLDANYTFLNERLARHYGIPNIYGQQLPPRDAAGRSTRGGLLGQGSILTITSYADAHVAGASRQVGARESAGVATAAAAARRAVARDEGAAGKPLTMREAMEQHRAEPGVRGLPRAHGSDRLRLEHFDAVGRWRSRTAAQPIDASGRVSGGDQVRGNRRTEAGAVASYREQFVGTVAEKLLMYAVGRNLQYDDAPAVRAIVRGGAPGTQHTSRHSCSAS